MYKQLNSFSRKKAFGKMSVVNDGMTFMRKCNFRKNKIIGNNKNPNNFKFQNIKNHQKNELQKSESSNEQLHICCDPKFCYSGKPETTKDGVTKKQKHVENCKPGICKWCEKQNFLMIKLEKDDELYCQEIAIEHNAFGCPNALENGYTRRQDRNGPVILDRKFLTEYILSGKSQIQKKKEAENRKINIWKNPKYDNYCVDAVILGEEIQKDDEETESYTLVEESKPLTLVEETESLTLVEEIESSTPFVEDTKHSAVELLVQLKITLTKNSKEQSSKSEIKEIDINNSNDSIVSETTEHIISETTKFDELKKEFEKLLQIFQITGIKKTPEIEKLFDDSFKILSQK